MTHVKQQRLWLKAKFDFTTVIYKFTHKDQSVFLSKITLACQSSVVLHN